MKILGIDPGSTRCGWGLIKKTNRLEGLDWGIKFFGAEPDEQKRLAALEQWFVRLLDHTQPDLVAMEKVFFAKNKKTALKVAQAKGVIIAATAKEGLDFLEFTPLEVKKILTQFGQASKPQVAKAVQMLLGLPVCPKPHDAADALAVAAAAATCYSSSSIVPHSSSSSTGSSSSPSPLSSKGGTIAFSSIKFISLI